LKKELLHVLHSDPIGGWRSLGVNFAGNIVDQIPRDVEDSKKR